MKIGKWGVMFLLLLLLSVFLIFTNGLEKLLEGTFLTKGVVNVFLGFSCVGVLLGAYYQYLLLSSVVYIIEDGFLRKREGVFTMNENFLELYRVMDLKLYSSVTGKVLGYYQLTLYSKDVSSPVLHISGIAHGQEVSIEIRKEIEKARRKARIFETL